jgi:hypothetical protein
VGSSPIVSTQSDQVRQAVASVYLLVVRPKVKPFRGAGVVNAAADPQ